MTDQTAAEARERVMAYLRRWEDGDTLVDRGPFTADLDAYAEAVRREALPLDGTEYEGAARGPWFWVTDDDGEWGELHAQDGTILTLDAGNWPDGPTALLMRDAPTLLARVRELEAATHSTIDMLREHDPILRESAARMSALEAALRSRHIAWLHTDGCAYVISPNAPIEDDPCDCGRDEAEARARALLEPASPTGGERQMTHYVGDACPGGHASPG